MKLNKIFNNYLTDIKNVGGSELFIIRNDGLLMASNIDKDLQTTAALATGMWQAAEAAHDGEESVDECSLSFANSDSGIFLVPLKNKNRSLYLCCKYKNEVNPGFLKQKIKKHRNVLLETLIELNADIENNRGEYLFPDLTDQEINKIFASVEMK